VENTSQSLLTERERLGLTQQEMADLLGVSRNYVSMIEVGKKPFADKLRRKLKRTDANFPANVCEPPPAPYGAPEAPELTCLRAEVAHLREANASLMRALGEALAKIPPARTKGHTP
jgi:transcriptional regulator with XRE-family HTH domain